jgi:glycosyltransferase involved in cell wall biosynthesis
MQKTRITFLVPCLNEKKTISLVLESIFNAIKKAKLKKYEVLIADNGSTDGTIGIIRSFSGVRIVKVPIVGYGAALDSGIKKSKGDWVIFADADLSYDFLEFKKFKKYLDEKYDLIVGNRLNGKIEKGAMPTLNRYLGTPVLSYLIRFIYGINTYDCNSGMRLVRKRFYKNLNMRNSGMEWASELIIRTSLNGGRYKEVNINYHKDKRGRPPHLRRWFDGWLHIKAILLLKPSVLMAPTLGLFLIAIVYRGTLYISLIYIFFAIALFLSIVAAWLINGSLDNKSPTSNLMRIFLRLPLVKVGAAITLTFLLTVSNIIHLGSEITILFAGIVILYDMWIFFIETIKTHLVNSLNTK